jgi:T5SS/PEP-CTERM-associated repeat protein
MARGCLEIATLALGLALAASPVRAEIELGTAGYRAFVQVFHDQNGDGVYDPDEDTTFDEADVNPAALPIDESWQVSLGPSAASGSARVEASLVGGTLRYSSTGSCAAAHQSGANEGANSRVLTGVFWAVTEQAQYSVTGTLTASAGARISAEGFTAQNETRHIDLTQTIAPGDNYVFPVDCWAFGGEGPDFSASWDLEVTVIEGDGEDECETMSWVGGRAGAFGVAENWDPPVVPQYIEDVRCDEMVVQGGRGVVIDLAGASAAGLGPLGGVERNVHGVTIDGSQELRPVNGTLVGDNLSPVVGERSLEIQQGGSLLLEGAAVKARHAAIGALGEGAIDVAGGGQLVTTGRLGLGVDGSGSLLVRGGGQVTAAEAVLGESVAQGSVTVRGPVSKLATGNLAVGLEDDGTLLVEAGGLVTSETGVIDFGLEGDSRGRAEVRGKDAAGNPSKWTADALDVGPRGSLDVVGGARVELAGPLSIGGNGAPSNCQGGLACVDVFDGVLEAAGVVVGDGGAGRLLIGAAGRVAAAGAFTIGTGDHYSEVQIAAGSDESVFTDLAIATAAGATGKLTLGSGARLDLLGRFRVGDGGGVDLAGGTFAIIGDAFDPLATRVSALDGSGLDSVVGGPTVLPTGHHGAQLQLEAAVLELSGAGHDLVIERNGFVNGGNARIVFDAGGKLVNKGALVGGGFLIEGDYVEEATAFLNASVFEVEAAPSPQGVRSLAAAPPPPPFQPLVVTGDATLAGKAVLQFGNGAAPQQGDQIALLEVQGDVTGAFGEIEVKGLAPGFGFDAALVNGAFVLTSLTDAEPLPYVNLAGKPLLLESKKAAKLKLTRSGDTTAPLTVAYTVGGTAESGVDFVALPGTIQFPARKKSVTLLVQPIADGLAEGSETIEITLAPDASFAPGLASELTLELRDGKVK